MSACSIGIPAEAFEPLARKNATPATVPATEAVETPAPDFGSKPKSHFGAVAFGVESANVVGYTVQSTPQAKFMLGSVPFEAISGGATLNGMFTGFTPVTIDWEGDYIAFQSTAAQLQIWNGSNYDMAYYVSNAWYDNGTEEGDFKEGWCDGDGVLRDSDYVITPGYAFWVKNVPDSKSLNIAGAVKTATSVSVDCPNKFMLVGNPYPVAINLVGGTEMTSEDITPVAIDWEGDYIAFQTTATQLQIWNGSNYDMAYYVSNAWYDNGTEEGDFKPGWCDGDGVLREGYVIPVGTGFWVKAASGACTLDFDNPTK